METHGILWVWAKLGISKYQEDHDDETYENSLAKVTCAARIESGKKASSQLQGEGSKMMGVKSPVVRDSEVCLDYQEGLWSY